MNKQLLKDILPPILLRGIKGNFYGWSGNYSDWNEVIKKTDGYDKDFIFEKVAAATREVASGKANYERDGVVFFDSKYNFELLTALAYIKMGTPELINVIDFGGSLGSIYWQHKNFMLPGIVNTWNVVEQLHYVKAGQSEFQDDTLKFHYTIKECMDKTSQQLMVLSSVLQYLPDPHSFIEEVLDRPVPYLFLDRTAFITGPNDRLTIQKVHPSIYNARYPCWFISEQKLFLKLNRRYETLFEFEALDQSNLRGTFFKGMFLKLKK